MLEARKLNQDYAYDEFPPVRLKKTSRKIRPKTAGPAREKLMIISSIGLVFVICLMFTATQAMITDRSNKIIQVKGEISVLQNSNERIKLEIAQKKSLDRIEQIARNDLGMVQPNEDTIEYIAGTQTAEEQPAISMAVPETAGKVSVALQSGEKMNPGMQSLNRLVSAYLVGINHVEASEQ